VINRELDADFAPDEFDHVAFFDRKHEWIEMRLRAITAQTVEVAAIGLSVEFEAGEELRTEISAKFTRARLEDDFAAAGLRLEHWFNGPGRPVRAVAGRAAVERCGRAGRTPPARRL